MISPEAVNYDWDQAYDGVKIEQAKDFEGRAAMGRDSVTLTYGNPPPAYASRRKQKRETQPFQFAFSVLYHPETQVLSNS
jgi:hypothetical protein